LVGTPCSASLLASRSTRAAGSPNRASTFATSRALAAAPLGLDPGPQPLGEVEPLVGPEHAVGGVGRLRDVVQHQLVRALYHV
jgi:hypothetical protein